MTPKRQAELLKTLRARFETNSGRHEGVDWAAVQARLAAAPDKLSALEKMESTGGEPDVVAYDPTIDRYVFYDCSAESPIGRRSLCYDREALERRKQNKPEGNAIDAASRMGIEILSEDEYQRLQTLGSFDTKTSSWVATPPAIRTLGGAIFCDRRYNRVFTYHNGADSYYAARGFRGSLKV